MFTSQFDYLYVEPSTYCVLSCERCPRTYEPARYKLTHLNQSLYTRVISDPLFKDIKEIEFGGNYGDPIMHPQFYKFIESTKVLREQAALTIHTSGQREPSWWHQLVKSLAPTDTVLFSIDGLEDTNHLYRKGARWDWLDQALDICLKKTNVIWKFIVFQHNEHQIMEVIDYAKRKGVHDFLLTKSHIFYGRWAKNSVDVLAPAPEWMAHADKEKAESFSPLCQTSSRHYLSAEGFYSPCCWMDLSKEFSLNLIERASYGFSDVMQDQTLSQLKRDWEGSAPPTTCRSKCSFVSSSKSRTSHSQMTLDLSGSLMDIENRVLDFKMSDKRQID